MVSKKNIIGLAEVCGIHAGDGYLRYHGSRKELDISGGYEERDYYKNHVIPLFRKTFNINIVGRYFPSRRTYGFCIRDRNVIEIMSKLRFPSGNKTTIVKIPEFILHSKNKNIISAFLRGYFDTDGCFTFDKKIGNTDPFKKRFHYYPRIMFNSCSKDLILGVRKLLDGYGIKYCYCLKKPNNKKENLKHQIQITGNKSLKKWLELVGSGNPCKYSRVLVWRRYGFCPPNTTYLQRRKILKGEINPAMLYKGL